MKVVVTGSSKGIGKAICEEFLNNGHQVVGIDILEETINHPSYTHFVADVSCEKLLPNIENVEILINNAGVQNERDMEVNLMGTIYCTEKYAVDNPMIKSVVNIASASAHTGAEFPLYSASKGGVLAYTKNVALRIAKFGATCNSLSPGGVITDINKHIIENKDLWDLVMAETLIPKWADCEEIAKWAYFVAVINKSMTAQDILIDNGEAAKSNFIW